jgi:amyloid beta precursor protein binding protein 1
LAQRKAFKESINHMKRKIDEENFEEAEAQAYRSWTETKVPGEAAELFDDPKLQNLNASCMLNPPPL